MSTRQATNKELATAARDMERRAKELGVSPLRFAFDMIDAYFKVHGGTKATKERAQQTAVATRKYSLQQQFPNTDDNTITNLMLSEILS